jgi:hypothetical protein
VKRIPLIAALLFSGGCATTARAGNDELRLNICFENKARLGAESGGLRRVTQALVGTLEKLGSPSVSVRIGPCGPNESSLRGCFGVERVIACRADDIAQLLLVAELAEKLEAIAPENVRARYEEKGAIAASDALASLVQRSLSTGEYDTQPLFAWISRDLKIPEAKLRKALDEALVGFATQPAPNEKKKLAHAASALMMDFLIGHELFHARGNRCDVAAKSIAEENNSWKFAIDSMSSNQLFCAEPFASDETRADQCGLRSVRAGRGVGELAKLSGVYAGYASSVAADALVWALITRHEVRQIERPEQNLTVPSPNYLHPVLRSALIADELIKVAASAPARPAWCDRMAQAMVIAIQKTVTGCEKGRGDVDDVLLARLPKSVVTAWEGGTWSEASFHCRVPMK